MKFAHFVEINPRICLSRGMIYPFVEMGDVTPGKRYVTASDEREFSGGGSKFQAGDTLFARITPCLENGKIAQFRASDRTLGFGSTEFFVFRSIEGVSDPAFVYYLVSTDLIRKPAEKSMSGASGRQRAGLSSVQNVEVPHVPLQTQRKIAAILSSYDNLIENNLRRIKILEEMAQNLYREWFVKFRFPGHGKVRLVHNSIGKMPEGWEVKSLESLIVEHIGGGWGKEDPDPDHTEPAWVIRGTDIPSARRCKVNNIPHRYHTVSNLRSRCLQIGDIVFEVSGGSKGQPVGRTLYVSADLLSTFGGDSVICASFCKRIRPDDGAYGSEMLYLSFLDGYESGEIEQFQVQSTGISNFKWTEYIQKTRRVVPPGKLRVKFHELITPLFSQIGVLGRANNNLVCTRELLLPRLLSGELDVSDLDIRIPEETA